MQTNFPTNVDSAICIVSGGLDSSVMLNEAAKLYSKVKGVSFNYGSKHNKMELPLAAWQCENLGIEHTLIDLGFINQHFKSSLLSSGEAIPDGSYSTENMASTVVPFRNGIMLSIAVGLAESSGYEVVLIGSHSGDHPIYPDCREDFTEAFSDAASEGTGYKIQVASPYSRLDKSEVAQRGRELEVVFSKTWTCYKGLEFHCGSCAACIERKSALKYDESLDPTKYLA